MTFTVLAKIQHLQHFNNFNDQSIFSLCEIFVRNYFYLKFYCTDMKFYERAVSLRPC